MALSVSQLAPISGTTIKHLMLNKEEDEQVIAF